MLLREVIRGLVTNDELVSSVILRLMMIMIFRLLLSIIYIILFIETQLQLLLEFPVPDIDVFLLT